MDWIDYEQLPASAGNYTQLFLDYLQRFGDVEKFFSHDFRNPAGISSAIDATRARSIDRGTLTEVLAEQNRLFGSGAGAFRNVELLAKPSTFAVVTGQQVGLFGGPLYTIFKTATAVKLARQLKEQFPDFDFVPVFWIEGEDHDFAEMNHVSLFNAENAATKIEYLPGGQMPERNLGPIGELVFDGALEATLSQVTATLQKTEFTADVLTSLTSCYTPGRTFNQAFAGWMNVLFRDLGLVFLSSNDRRLKRLVSPLFVRELEEFPGTSQLVIQQSAELEQKYHAQIKAKSINLFLFHKGGRYLIEPRENDFSLRGTRHFLQKDELLRIAREEPELLSPNVVLRPLVQDSLLPTVAYVAGPAEIAYQAQLKPVYEHFGVVQPAIFPRASGSFVEERLRRAIDKYGLDLLAFFGDINKITARVVEQISDVKLEALFGDAIKRLHESLSELQFGLKEIDPTLLPVLQGVVDKMDANLGNLKEKSVASQKRRNEAAVRQVERSANSLLPNGGLQEREINILYFMNKYGPSVVRKLFDQLEINAFKHQVLQP